MVRVAFLAGNGHTEARLERAREALARRSSVAGRPVAGRPVELVTVDGGDAATFDAYLEAVASQVVPADAIYATGIGGLVALALRARDEGPAPRTILQGPVLWGLESRRFPRLMRLPGMTTALVLALRTPMARRRFVRRHFETPPDPDFVRRFFEGYGDAAAFRRWFAWLTPELLRSLERRFQGRLDRLDGVEVWWGGRDHVVGPDELRVTEAALGRTFPLRTFPSWGHYPMIDDPEGWAREVQDALASAG